ncbi:MAG: Rieske 2Fe-2S domain-containing protein, partial [Acidobacteriota bacterium]|nr:Rieske 2Fe-2S domain-containing protein [Acidobacteriota bacterium]
MPLDWTIEEDIRGAATLPAEVYADPGYLALARERIFARSWQWVGDADAVKVPGQVLPVTLLEGLLDEPLLLTRDARDELHCLSNVCTHRGTLLCPGAAVEQVLRCRYHGRRFALDGRILASPEFEGAKGFPSAADDLPKV